MGDGGREGAGQQGQDEKGLGTASSGARESEEASGEDAGSVDGEGRERLTVEEIGFGGRGIGFWIGREFLRGRLMGWCATDHAYTYILKRTFSRFPIIFLLGSSDGPD